MKKIKPFKIDMYGYFNYPSLTFWAYKDGKFIWPYEEKS